MRVIDTSVQIAAPPESVWEVLVDFPRYAEWNSFIRRAEGRAEPGETLAVFIQPPGDRGMTHRPTVLTAEPGRRLRWLGQLSRPWLFSAEHEFLLSPVPGGTLLQHQERFRGLLVPFLRATLNRTEIGFHRFNEALRQRVERRLEPEN